ncbi:hypothetical protein RM863_38690 [Streptomyces sp. DSM 41014]|uniref:Lipoprotein n=1 Tax=Streptomyces hintoniae TaxID=3075521 RepID=A0ABU2UYE9_9ACTN|nr:hypothetical protein [Streptomyces sp. DSM 41014]MDT0478059.1 hypothetical protein [Streptomyces sp. DSM 41014]
MAVWGTGALTGCQTIADAASASGCEGTESRVDDLKSYGILDSWPHGTIKPRGFKDLDAGCWEDSGEVQLYAERTYVFAGNKVDVTKYYRAAAEREGWQPSHATRQSSKVDQPTNLCFTRGEADDAARLDVYFLTMEILDAEESKVGPEFGSGVGYRVSITSSADGSATSCSD